MRALHSEPPLPPPGPSGGFSDAVTGVLGVAWQKYLIQLQKRPLRTKSITSACIAGLSDVIAQLLVSGRYQNWKRTLAVACFGMLYTGPCGHFWQKFMEYLFSGKTDLQTVLLKVFVDQVTYGPFCNVLFMSFATLVLEGRSVPAALQKIRKDYPGVQLYGWRLWPFVALVNYRFVPVQFRVGVINVVALLWTTFVLLKAKRTQALLVVAKPAAS